MDNQSTRTILIVDDNPQNLQLFGSVLKNNGYKPLLSQNGENAISFVENNQPDLILLDVMMPGMNGYEVCEHLKKMEASKHIPIIFITAKTEPEDILHGFEVGGVDYIAKPFNIPELLARVKTHVELKKAQDMITKQSEELKILNNSKDRLFSIIGHDLRNPFSGIISFSNLLIDEFDDFTDQEKLSMIETISKSANQGFRLLENLLDWSRSHSGFIDFKLETKPISDLIDLCTDLLAPFAAQKKISMTTNIHNNSSIPVDTEMFTTIIRNLVSNAIKFTPTGGSIHISSEIAPQEIILHIADTGVGIPQNVQHKIFSVGDKYSSFGTEKEKGTGLGLLLAKEFINRHNGRIWFKSELGKGSTFSVAFPLKQE